jgi:hypothetical protein
VSVVPNASDNEREIAISAKGGAISLVGAALRPIKGNAKILYNRPLRPSVFGRNKYSFNGMALPASHLWECVLVKSCYRSIQGWRGLICALVSAEEGV